MARTGEERKTKQPLKIDRLPPSVHEAICYLYNTQGKVWKEIERLSAEPVGKGHLGFVDWEKLDTEVLELFPRRRIPHSNLHRWYDIRRAQVRRDVLQRSEQARSIAEAFAASSVANGDEAVFNAARDTFMSVLSEDSTSRGRINAGKALIGLAEVMQKSRSNDIKERKVAVDEQSLQIKLDLIKAKTAELLKDAGSDGTGEPALSRAEVIERVKDIYGVA